MLHTRTFRVRLRVMQILCKCNIVERNSTGNYNMRAIKKSEDSANQIWKEYKATDHDPKYKASTQQMNNVLLSTLQARQTTAGSKQTNSDNVYGHECYACAGYRRILSRGILKKRFIIYAVVLTKWAPLKESNKTKIGNAFCGTGKHMYISSHQTHIQEYYGGKGRMQCHWVLLISKNTRLVLCCVWQMSCKW